MLKGLNMLIGEFAKRSGVSVDTVRFYVRKGLLTPDFGATGGRNPYATFSRVHLERMRLIRLSQSFGMSLNQLASIKREIEEVGLTRERQLEIGRSHLASLEKKLEELHALVAHLRASVEIIENIDKTVESVPLAYEEMNEKNLYL